MTYLANRVKVSTATTGTGPITVGAAEPGFQTLASAGVPTGATVSYLLEDGLAAELGSGVYDSSAGTVTRNFIWSTTGARLNLSGNAKRLLSLLASDVVSLDKQPFTANGLWQKRRYAKNVYLVGIGGGAGGGGGRTGAAGTARSGGGGGSGAGWSDRLIDASLLGDTEPVFIGAGGAGGISRTTDTTSGAPGASGGNTTFGSIFVAGGGLAAGFATTSNLNSVSGGTGSVIGGSSGGTSVTANGGTPPPPLGIAPGGGGGGGSISTGNVALNAGLGGSNGSGQPVVQRGARRAGRSRCGRYEYVRRRHGGRQRRRRRRCRFDGASWCRRRRWLSWRRRRRRRSGSERIPERRGRCRR